MIWRLHADIYFANANRRTTFIGSFNAWKAQQGTVILESIESIDDDGAGPLAYPLVRIDLCFENDQKNLDAMEQIKTVNPGWLRFVFASLHRCSIGTGNPPLPDGPHVYYTMGTAP